MSSEILQASFSSEHLRQDLINLVDGEFFKTFTAAFITIFVLIDAVGVAPVFQSLAAQGDARYQHSMAIRSPLLTDHLASDLLASPLKHRH